MGLEASGNQLGGTGVLARHTCFCPFILKVPMYVRETEGHTILKSRAKLWCRVNDLDKMLMAAQ